MRGGEEHTLGGAANPAADHQAVTENTSGEITRFEPPNGAVDEVQATSMLRRRYAVSTPCK